MSKAFMILRYVLAITLITAALLTFTPSEAAPKSYMLPEIVKVIDGDTIKIILSPLKDYPPLDNVSIRILGIDTPEHDWRAKCLLEKELGLKAKQHVIDLIGNAKRIKVTNYKWDKYGGRIDGNVSINSIDIGQSLIDNNLARPYTGKGPKSNWCFNADTFEK